MPELVVIQDLCEIDFSETGNSENYIAEGWSGPEDDFTWAEGEESSIEFSELPAGSDLILEFSLFPMLNPPALLSQRISVTANDVLLAEARIELPVTLQCRIPGPLVRDDGILRVTFGHPDGGQPAEWFGDNADTRVLSVAFQNIKLRVLGIAAEIERPVMAFAREAGPFTPPEFDPDLGRDAHALAVLQRTGMTAAELAGRFESLGNNCEFGFFQRLCGCEAMGLFRFSDPEHEVVLNEIRTNFATYGDTAIVQLDEQTPRREWNVVDPKRNLTEHTFIWEGEQTEEEVRRTALKRLAFLRRMMIENLRDGTKIFVIKSAEGNLNRDIVTTISQALREHGPNWLLWVVPGLQVGRVVQLGDGLLRGTIDRLMEQADSPDLSVSGWLAVLTEAWLAIQASNEGQR